VSLLLLYLWLAGSWPDSHSGGATGFGIGGGALKAGLAGGGASAGTTLSSLGLFVAGFFA
jgi:hypothetical protein